MHTFDIPFIWWTLDSVNQKGQHRDKTNNCPAEVVTAI